MNTPQLLQRLLVLLLATSLWSACKEKPKTTAEIPAANDQPVLTMYQTDGSEVFLRGLSGNVILIFFNPDCDHCQREAKAIAENERAFENYQLYFISSDSIKNVERFASDYQLEGKGNIHMGRSESLDVYNAMGPLNQVPAIFIYQDRKKIKEFLGETPIEEIKKFL